MKIDGRKSSGDRAGRRRTAQGLGKRLWPTSLLVHAEAAARRGRREAIVGLAPGGVARFVARHRRRAPFRLAAVAAQAYLSAFENEDWDIHHNGEELLLSSAARLWPERFVALDIGSFAGDWAQIALKNNPNTEVHCFEIVEHLSQRVAARFAGDSRVIVNGTGLWSMDTELSGHFTPRFPSMSSVVPAVKAYTGDTGQGFRATVETGDNYCARHAIDRINFMKIDVEGAEFEVLRGFAETFRRGMVDLVQFEYGPLALAARYQLEDEMTFLTSNGMRFGKLYPTHVGMSDHYFPGLDDYRWGNYVAMRPDVAAKLGSIIARR